jgi:sRNA-binding protein
MTDVPRPSEVLARAASDFDEACHNPARREDAMGNLFAGLGAAFAAVAEEGRRRRAQEREARKNDPQAKARRSAAARRGAATRKDRKAREEAADLDRYTPYRPGPRCDELNHNSVGSEVFCQLDPGHDDDHDDDCGTTWERED